MTKILIVDDDVLTVRMLELILGRQGHHVIGFASGEGAIEYLAENQIDVLITDIMMPEVDGFSLVDLVKSNRRFKNLPVIMFTASANKAYENLAREKGAVAFLYQPFSSKDLENVLAKCVAGTNKGEKQMRSFSVADAPGDSLNNGNSLMNIG